MHSNKKNSLYNYDVVTAATEMHVGDMQKLHAGIIRAKPENF